jgi:hypothetical protein
MDNLIKELRLELEEFELKFKEMGEVPMDFWFKTKLKMFELKIKIAELKIKIAELKQK